MAEIVNKIGADVSQFNAAIDAVNATLGKHNTTVDSVAQKYVQLNKENKITQVGLQVLQSDLSKMDVVLKKNGDGWTYVIRKVTEGRQAMKSAADEQKRLATQNNTQAMMAAFGFGDLKNLPTKIMNEVRRAQQELARAFQSGMGFDQIQQMLDRLRSGNVDLYKKGSGQDQAQVALLRLLDLEKRITAEKEKQGRVAVNVNRTQLNAFSNRLQQALPVPSSANPASLLAYQNALSKVIRLAGTGKVPLEQLNKLFTDIAKQPFGQSYATATPAIQQAAAAIQRLIVAQQNAKRSADQLGEAGKRAGNGIFLSFQQMMKILEIQVIHRAFGSLLTGMQSAVGGAADLQLAISEIRTISQQTDVTFQEFQTTIRGLSEEFGRSQADVAAAMYEGFSNQVIKTRQDLVLMNEVLRFSRIAVASTADSMNLLSSALNAYRRPTEDARTLSDQLFRAIDIGRFRASDIANTFGRVAVVSREVGVEFNELLGMMANLTRAGILPAEAMTQISSVMQALIRPSDDMKRLLREWGVESGIQAVQTMGFIGVLERLFDESQRGSGRLGELIHNVRALRGVMGATGGGLGELRNDISRIGASGPGADRALEIMSESAGDKFKRELIKIQNFFTNDFANGFLESVNRMAAPFGGFATIIKDVSIALLQVVNIGLQFIGIVGNMIGVLKPLGLNIGNLVQMWIAWKVSMMAVSSATTIYTTIISLKAAATVADSAANAANMTTLMSQTAATTVATTADSTRLAGIWANILATRAGIVATKAWTVATVAWSTVSTAWSVALAVGMIAIQSLTAAITTGMVATRAWIVTTRAWMIASAAGALITKGWAAATVAWTATTTFASGALLVLKTIIMSFPFVAFLTGIAVGIGLIIGRMAAVRGRLEESIESMRRMSNTLEDAFKREAESESRAARERATAFREQLGVNARIPLEAIRLMTQDINRMIQEQNQVVERTTSRMNEAWENVKSNLDGILNQMRTNVRDAERAIRDSLKRVSQFADRESSSMFQRLLQAAGTLPQRIQVQQMEPQQLEEQREDRASEDVSRQRQIAIIQGRVNTLQEEAYELSRRGDRESMESARRRFEEIRTLTEQQWGIENDRRRATLQSQLEDDARRTGRSQRGTLNVDPNELQRRLEDLRRREEEAEGRFRDLQQRAASAEEARIAVMERRRRAVIESFQAISNFRITNDQGRLMPGFGNMDAVRARWEQLAGQMRTTMAAANLDPQAQITLIQAMEQQRVALFAQAEREMTRLRLSELAVRVTAEREAIQRLRDEAQTRITGARQSTASVVSGIPSYIANLGQDVSRQGTGQQQENFTRLSGELRTALDAYNRSRGGAGEAEALATLQTRLNAIRDAYGSFIRTQVGLTGTLTAMNDQGREITQTGAERIRIVTEALTGVTGTLQQNVQAIRDANTQIAEAERRSAALASTIRDLPPALQDAMLNAALAGPAIADGLRPGIAAAETLAQSLGRAANALSLLRGGGGPAVPAVPAAPGFAEGGLIGSGFNNHGQDNTLISARTGEFVVEPNATRRFYSQLVAINSGRLPSFADGGLVGDTTNVGDVTININESTSPGATAREVMSRMRRETRRRSGRA